MARGEEETSQGAFDANTIAARLSQVEKQNRTLKYLLAVLVSIVIVGAGAILLLPHGSLQSFTRPSVKDIKVTEENKDSLFEQIKNSRDLTVEEVSLLYASQLRQGLANALAGQKSAFPVGQTIGEMIEAERQYQKDATVREEENKRKQAEDRGQREQAAAEAAKQQQVLQDALSVTVYDKDFLKIEYQDYIDPESTGNG